MAAIKGVKEKVHLPLYDSIFVGAGRQLRDIASSSVLKFFVNVNGKTKLETNMQSASLLPHWNTFEARALRVVVSDLPARFPREIEQCLREPGPTPKGRVTPDLKRCMDLLAELIGEGTHAITSQQVNRARQRVKGFKDTIREVDDIPAEFGGAIGILRIYADRKKMTPILQLQSELRAIRKPLVDVLRRTKIELPAGVTTFVDHVEKLEDVAEEKNLLRQITDVNLATDAFEQLVKLVGSIDQSHFKELDDFCKGIEQFLEKEHRRAVRLEQLKACLQDVLKKLEGEPRQPQIEDITRCLNETLSDKRRVPADEQLLGGGLPMLSKLIYNSVTTFVVGEKTMIQMPTWFFPAGAGPFSEDGKTVTHGFPAPEATFRFAEPVSIDTQQNFRVEIEFPEAEAAEGLQRIYGPFFIWVVLDGYMTRDVQ